jgi:hypothetical protein
MGVPTQDRERVFRPEDDRANFTFLHDVEDVQVRDGTLAFTLPEGMVTLGWGNYNGQQALTEIEDMCQQTAVVRLRLKQSAGSSRWSAATSIEQDYWVAEVALRYEAFGVSGPQRAWRLNVCRRMRNDLLEPSTWSWLPGDWHDPDHFGHLRFEGVAQ